MHLDFPLRRSDGSGFKPENLPFTTTFFQHVFSDNMHAVATTRLRLLPRLQRGNWNDRRFLRSGEFLSGRVSSEFIASI